MTKAAKNPVTKAMPIGKVFSLKENFRSQGLTDSDFSEPGRLVGSELDVDEKELVGVAFAIR